MQFSLKMGFLDRDLKINFFGAVTSWWSGNEQMEYVVYLDSLYQDDVIRKKLSAQASRGLQFNLLGWFSFFPSKKKKNLHTYIH